MRRTPRVLADGRRVPAQSDDVDDDAASGASGVHEDDVACDRARSTILSGRGSRAYIVGMSHPIASLSNHDLVAAVDRLSTIERDAVADLIEALAEFDERRLYLAEGRSSLFAYCTTRLGLSEHEAYHRIEAARTARRFPLVPERLRDRALTLTAVGLLRPHLTEANHRAVLDAARGKSKREVEELVARLAPRADVATSIRKAPQRVAATEASPRSKPEGLLRPMNPVPHVTGTAAKGSSVGTRLQPCAPTTATADAMELQPCTAAAVQSVSPSTQVSEAQLDSDPILDATSGPVANACRASERRPSQGTVRPLAPARYHLQMTVDADTHAALRKLQDLLRPEVPNGEPALIVGRALSFLLAHVERRKFAAKNQSRGVSAKGRARGTRAVGVAANPERGAEPERESPYGEPPRTAARYIPAVIRRAVWLRDDGQCTFVGPGGRCSERGRLEFHHRVPLGQGGATSVGNVALMCRNHNQWRADLDYGECTMKAHRARADRTRATSAERKAGIARGTPDDRPGAAARWTQSTDLAPADWRDSVQTELAGPMEVSP